MTRRLAAAWNRGIEKMTDYRKMYFQLAAQVADAVDILLKAQHVESTIMMTSSGQRGK